MEALGCNSSCCDQPCDQPRDQLTSEDVQGRLDLLVMIHSFVTPYVLKAAVELRIPDVIAEAGTPLTAEEILIRVVESSSAPARNPQLEILQRILRFLSEKGVLQRTYDDRYALNRISQWLVGGDQCRDILAPLLMMEMHERCQASWQTLHEVVLEGGDAFQRANGSFFWELGQKDQNFNRVVNDAMIAFSTTTMAVILQHYTGFRSVRTLVDVGGGMGHSVAKIVQAYPHIRGINYDLPHVIATAPKIKGVEHASGSMFDSVPAADAIFLKSVLHNWSDEHCVKLLKNCYQALPANGKLIIVDIIFSNNKSRDSMFAANLDMIMVAYTTGGKERTPAEWEDLLWSCGFSSISFYNNMPTKEGVIEAVKVAESKL